MQRRVLAKMIRIWSQIWTGWWVYLFGVAMLLAAISDTGGNTVLARAELGK